jgi:hypothetical protein
MQMRSALILSQTQSKKQGTNYLPHLEESLENNQVF